MADTDRLYFRQLLSGRSGLGFDWREFGQLAAARPDGLGGPQHLPVQRDALVATRIVNEVKGINRVVYDYTSKPPGTIEWE